MPSAHGLFPTQPEPSRELLLEWLNSNGSVIHDDVEIYESDHGWGVRATRDIEFDELRMFPPAPSGSCMNTNNSSEFTQNLDPIIPNDLSQATYRAVDTRSRRERLGIESHYEFNCTNPSSDSLTRDQTWCRREVLGIYTESTSGRGPSDILGSRG